MIAVRKGVAPPNYMGYWQRFQNRRTQWLALSIALVCFALMVALSLVQERCRITQEQENRLSTQARVIDENIQRQLQGVANALLSVSRDFDYLSKDVRFLTRRLQALSDVMPGVRTINVLDSSGRVLASNREPVVGLDLSNREYFQSAVRMTESDALFLSEPFLTVLDVYSINLVRVIRQPDEKVAYVLTATLEPEFFQVLMSSVRFADDVWVALAHGNGRLFLHYPSRPDLLGFRLDREGSFFSRHKNSGKTATVLAGEVASTGQMAWMAQRTITAPELNMRGELIIAVARSSDMALRYWWIMVVEGAAIVALVAVISVLMLWSRNVAQDKVKAVLLEEERLRKSAEEEIRQMAFHDHLTQLPNRHLLFDRLGQLLAASVRHGRYSALLFLDLDDFKQLNDQHGHDKGDLLLQQVGERLKSQVRQDDTAARWAGDEFIVMLAELGKDANEASRIASQVAKQILASLAREYDLNGLNYKCTASLGVTLFGGREEPMDDIIKRADHAMYQAKAQGRNAYQSTQAG